MTLTTSELPSHRHTLGANDAAGSSTTPTGYLARDAAGSNLYINSLTSTTTAMSSSMTTDTGGSLSHTNLMPYLCVNFIIALFGIYPSRQ